jgi:protoporphyrinogen oxidase
MKHKFVIIGAGPAGLGAGYKLKELGENDYIILERNPWVGGLATSFVDPQGFTWDIGGHVQFSHYPYFDQAMLRAIPAAGWLHHERESWVWIHNRFVPYPFQNNIKDLPKDAMWSCLKGLIDVSVKPVAGKPANFHEWILASFGEGIANEFMLPYNFKTWAHHPNEMAYQWIGERVATINLQRIVENIVYDRMDASWGPNNTFQFPAKGGTGAIWSSIGSIVGLDHVRLNTAVEQINAKEKTVVLKDGTTLQYENLLSTIPLDKCAASVKDLPESLKSTAQKLRHSSTNVVGIGIEGQPSEELRTKCWMYFPESSTPFYRMTLFSKYSPANVPDIKKHYSLMCEVSESDRKPVNAAQVVEETVRGLKVNGLLGAKDKIISKWHYREEYGYPTPSLERDNILRQVVPALDSLGVYSRGRFGGWKYEVSNQDHTFMQGVEWASKIVSGEAEQTYRVDTDRDPNLTLFKK